MDTSDSGILQLKGTRILQPPTHPKEEESAAVCIIPGTLGYFSLPNQNKTHATLG